MQAETEEGAMAARQAVEIRRLLARELHDRVAQTLHSMLVELENFRRDQKDNQIVVREVIGLQQSTREVLNNLRRVLYDLRNEDGIMEDFVDQVRAAVIRFQEKSQTKAILSVLPSWPHRLNRRAGVDLLGIVEEALVNIRRHSGATLAELVLGAAAENDAEVAIEIRDDGRGFVTDLKHASGHGTVGMRERALLHGGRLEIQPAPGGGTCVRAIFPKEQIA